MAGGNTTRMKPAVRRRVRWLREYPHILVKKLGRQIRSVRPDNRAEGRVNAEQLEFLRVPQRAEDLAIEFPGEIDLAFRPSSKRSQIT